MAARIETTTNAHTDARDESPTRLNETSRAELPARAEELHARAVELNARMNPPATAKPGRLLLLIGGLIGLPTGGYFVLGGWGIAAGFVLFVVALVFAVRSHEANMRKLHPEMYAKGKGYIA